jgi:TonB family protein
VKRLLPAVICALALHAIILSIDFSWLKLASDPAPVSRSLLITLSAGKLLSRNAQTAVPNNEPEKRFQPELQQKLTEKLGPIPADVRIESAAQIQKQSPTVTPQKPRPKKNLKALTRKIKIVKATDATRAETTQKNNVSPAAHTKIFSPVSSAKQHSHDSLPADTTFTKKTDRMRDGYRLSMTSAATLTSRQSDNSASATALTMAQPLYRQNPAPEYPHKARRMGYEGMVMLKVLVDENGQVDDLMVLESSGYPILDHTALTTVRKWLFEPGAEGGIKKKMWVRVPVRFQLK